MMEDFWYSTSLIAAVVLVVSVVVFIVVAVFLIWMPDKHDRKKFKHWLLDKRYENYKFGAVDKRIVYHLRMSTKTMAFFAELGVTEGRLGHFYRMVNNADKKTKKLWRRYVRWSGITVRQRAVGALLLLAAVPVSSRDFWFLNREEVLRIALSGRVPVDMIPQVMKNGIDLDLFESLAA